VVESIMGGHYLNHVIKVAHNAVLGF
jgi:hypothetical protein